MPLPEPMPGYQADSYGERFAGTYDTTFAGYQPPPGQIELLRALAAGGIAAELGVGTGRIALPLARTGVPVIGIDTSQAMLDQLAQKKGSLPVQTLLADASEFELADSVTARLVYVVFNTFFMIPGTAAQLACLKRVHGLLAEGGALVIETFVPRPERFGDGQSVRVKALTVNEVVLQVSQHNPDAQRVDSQDVVLRHGEPVQLFPTQVHYQRPEQLDALALRSGFALENRWAGWDGEPFDPTSGTHVSVYRAVATNEVKTWQ